MKIIFNTSAINSVGVKIYFDNKLKKECIIKGGIYPVFVEINEEQPDTLVLETCYESELLSPEIPQIYCNEFNSKVYKETFKGGYLDEVGKLFKTCQFAYRTEISIEKCPTEVFLDFISLEDIEQCALCVKKIKNATEDFKSKIKHVFVRKYSKRKILLKLSPIGIIQLIPIILVCIMCAIYLWIPVNDMDHLSVNFHGMIIGDVILISVLCIIIPLMFFGFTMYRAYKLLKREEIEIFIEQIDI